MTISGKDDVVMVGEMRRGRLLAGVGLAVALLAGEAGATSLRDALIQTYNSNPTITGARAQLRGLDENVAIAKAGGRISAVGSVTFGQNFDGIGTIRSRGRNLQFNTNVTLPVFQGGRVGAQVNAADARVEAGRADLRSVEADLFTEAVGAYMDVIRDQSIVELNQNLIRVLEANLQASSDRFEVGDLTRTDVAQSEARLANARSQLATAQGNLVTSQENFRRVTGLEPLNLEAPPPLPALPSSPDRAVEVSVSNNPQLASIAASARAAGFDVDAQKAAQLPTLALTAGTSYLNYLGTLGAQSGLPGIGADQIITTSNVGVRVTMPIYQGGLVAARVRQARALQSQALEQTVLVERAVVARARSSYASFRAADEAIAANQSAISANNLALEGARAENSVGTRTVIEVLNAEQELLNAQVALVSAQRNRYVAGFALLNAMGQAELEDLNLENPGPLYDPTINYDRVSRARSDFRIGDPPMIQSSRTIGPVVQGPVAPRP